MRECVACNRVKKCTGVHRWEIVHLKSSRCVSERASAPQGAWRSQQKSGYA